MPKISQGNTLQFHYFRVLKNFMLQRVMSLLSIFCLNFFCLTVPNNFVGAPFSVKLVSGIEKVWIRGGKTGFSVKYFLSHSAENLRCVTV